MLSIDAEDAVFQINTSQSIVPRDSKPRRWLRRRPSIYQRVLTELAVGRIVAAGESYLLMRATRKLKPELLAELPPPASDPVMDRLRQAAKNFGTLCVVWRVDVGIDLDSLNPAFTEFARLRELRHVLVHRLGFWQPGLDPKDKLEGRIAALGIDPQRYRGPIPLAADEVPRSVHVTLDLVDTVDPMVP
jgi:hypothetical protein